MPETLDTGGDARVSWWEQCCEIQKHTSLRQPHAPFTPHAPALFSLPKPDMATAESIPRGTPRRRGSRQQAPLTMPCIPARQTGTVPGGDVSSRRLLSRLPMRFPRKKDGGSMCWDKLNKHTFKIESRSPLFPPKPV